MTPRTIGEYYQALYETFDSSLYQQLVADYQLPNKRYQQYSKGMQGLLMVIAAYASNCKYLIFDEPLDGLDVMIRKQVIDLLLDTISEGQRSILISSHNLVELEKIVDQVAFLKNHTISSTLELEQRKLMTKKIQFVFKQKEIPQTVKDYGRILSVNGRVVIAVFDDYSAEVNNQLLALAPVLFEELPLTLEDLFIQEYSERPTKGGTNK